MTVLLPDSGKSSLCPQEAATLGLLFRSCEVCTWDPQHGIDEKVFGGWALVSWLQGMETPEEVSLGDGTLGSNMVRPQEKEKITQDVGTSSFLEIPAYENKLCNSDCGFPGFQFSNVPFCQCDVKQRFLSELDSIHILAFLSSANQHPSSGPIAGTISVSVQEGKVSLFTSIFHTYLIWHFSLPIVFYF